MADKEFLFGALPETAKPTTPPPPGKIWTYGNFPDPNLTPGTNEYASSYKNRWVLVDKPAEGSRYGITGEVGTPTGRRKDVWSSGIPGSGKRQIFEEYYTPGGGTEWRATESGGVTELVQEDERVASLNLTGSGTYNSPLLSNGQPYTGNVRGLYYQNGVYAGGAQGVGTGKTVTGYTQWRHPVSGVTYNVPQYSDGTDATSEWTGGAQVPQSFTIWTPESQYGGSGGGNFTYTASDGKGFTTLKRMLVTKQTLILKRLSVNLPTICFTKSFLTMD